MERQRMPGADGGTGASGADGDPSLRRLVRTALPVLQGMWHAIREFRQRGDEPGGTSPADDTATSSTPAAPIVFPGIALVPSAREHRFLVLAERAWEPFDPAPYEASVVAWAADCGFLVLDDRDDGRQVARWTGAGVQVALVIRIRIWGTDAAISSAPSGDPRDSDPSADSVSPPGSGDPAWFEQFVKWADHLTGAPFDTFQTFAWLVDDHSSSWQVPTVGELVPAATLDERLRDLLESDPPPRPSRRRPLSRRIPAAGDHGQNAFVLALALDWAARGIHPDLASSTQAADWLETKGIADPAALPTVLDAIVRGVGALPGHSRSALIASPALATGAGHLVVFRRLRRPRRTNPSTTPLFFFEALSLVPRWMLESEPTIELTGVPPHTTDGPTPLGAGYPLVGATAFFDALSDFELEVDPPESGYRVSPGLSKDGAKTTYEKRLAMAIASASSTAQVDMLVAPEGTGGPLANAMWVAALDEHSSSEPGSSLSVVVSGSGDSPDGGGDGLPTNRAEMLARSSPTDSGAAAWSVVSRHDKLRPYQLPISVGRWWGVLEDGSPVRPIHYADTITVGATHDDELVAEAVANGTSIHVVDTEFGRLATLICQDLNDLHLHLGRLAAVGVTHVFVPVFDSDLYDGRWSLHRAKVLSELADCEVVVANHTAVQATSDPDRPEYGACASLWARPGGRSALVSTARSRAEPTATMIPQYGRWGTPLERADLQRGDVLFFLRNPTGYHAPIGPLNAFIAGLDDTHCVHAAVVVKAPTAKRAVALSAIKVADSYNAATVRTLDELADYLTFPFDGTSSPARNPILVSRPVVANPATASAGSATPAPGEQLASAAEKLAGQEAVYPIRDLLLAAMFLRAKQRGAGTSALNAWAALLEKVSLAMHEEATGGGGDDTEKPGPGLMCAAFVAQANEIPTPEGNPPTEPTDIVDLTPREPDHDADRLGLHDTFGRRWLVEGLPADTSSLYDQADDIFASLLDEHFPVASLAVETLEEYVENPAEFEKSATDEVKAFALTLMFDRDTDADKGTDDAAWLASLDTLAEKATPDERRPRRFFTVADLLQAKGLQPFGYIGDIGDTDPTAPGGAQ